MFQAARQATTEAESLVKHCIQCGQASETSKFCCAACETLHALQQNSLPEVQASEEYAYLDQPNFRSLYKQPMGESDYIFYAEGMHCSSCVHLLERLPSYCDSVSAARVDFAQSAVRVSLQQAGSLAKVAVTIKSLGYEPFLLAPEDRGLSQQKAENRKALRRIAVAGFCAGNTMLFVVPIYAGLAGSMKDIFNWISFLLFLPVLLYSAQSFYKGALTSLKYRVISVDLPIAVALTAGFVFSLLNLIRGDGAIYFDSTASFLFLILCARYLLKSVQKNHLASPTLKNSLTRQKYLRLKSLSARETIPFSEVKMADVLAIAPGQALPSDCQLLSENALLDLSLFNGESLPKHFTKGMTLLGGTKNLQEEILVKVQLPFNESKIGAFCQQLDQSVATKNSFMNLTDFLAQRLIVSVFALALVFFALYSAVDVSEAFNRSLALIVLACPCALAFGAPLTYGFALRKAIKLGIFVKDPNTFEKILKIKNIFFDKTGTLTEGQLKLTHTEPQALSPEIRSVILSLESHSYHPIAFALRAAWNEMTGSLNVASVKEILGYGIIGEVNGNSYELRTLGESSHEEEVAVELLENKIRIACLYFADALRTESRDTIETLRQEGLSCFILSGDRGVRCLSVGKECAIEPRNIFSELFPEDKKRILSQHADTCMLGDGANDALSLQAADVGIAVKGSVDLSLTHSDVYFTKGGLTPFLELRAIAANTRKILYRNLSISLVYNVVGAALALSGFINPMMAAILMPISSAAVVLSSLWGFR